MNYRFVLTSLSALLAAGVSAHASSVDGRSAELVYSSNPMSVSIAPGDTVTLVFSSFEKIRSVSVGDLGAVQVVVSSAGDSLTLHSLRALAPTLLTVETNRRSYNYLLQSVQPGSEPYLVRMVDTPFASQAQKLPSEPSASSGIWRIKGAKALRPQSISDDGIHVYIRWSPSQLIPGVFAVNEIGREEMVDGYMRDDVFTLDRVSTRLVFRIDKAHAEAVRVGQKELGK